MRMLPLGRLPSILSVLAVLAVGFVLGNRHATANGSRTPTIDLTVYDEVLDVDGTVVVEGGKGFVVFPDASGQTERVTVRGWDPKLKKGIVGEGSAVRVTGLLRHGEALDYRGHVTVLR